MADYVFQQVELCTPCGAKIPKVEAIEVKLFVDGKRVRRYFCSACFAKYVFPHLLTPEEKKAATAASKAFADAIAATPDNEYGEGDPN